MICCGGHEKVYNKYQLVSRLRNSLLTEKAIKGQSFSLTKKFDLTNQINADIILVCT